MSTDATKRWVSVPIQQGIKCSMGITGIFVGWDEDISWHIVGNRDGSSTITGCTIIKRTVPPPEGIYQT